MLRNLRELYSYRELLWSLTQRELKARYRASVLGFFWTFLNPMLLMSVYALVFGVFLRQSIEHYTFFVFVGLLPWIWFSSSVSGGTSAISDRRDLLTKVRFPAQVLPAQVVTTNLLNYLLSLPLMVALGAAFGRWPSWHVVFFPLVLLAQGIFTLALVYVLSALNVAFRDLQHIVNNLLTLWFFGTPVLYLTQNVPAVMREAFVLSNPLALIITSYQAIFYGHEIPRVGPLLLLIAGSTLLLWLATRVFESRREAFAELV